MAAPDRSRRPTYISGTADLSHERPAAGDQNQPFPADTANVSWWQRQPLELTKWTIDDAPQTGRSQ